MSMNYVRYVCGMSVWWLQGSLIVWWYVARARLRLVLPRTMTWQSTTRSTPGLWTMGAVRTIALQIAARVTRIWTVTSMKSFPRSLCRLAQVQAVVVDHQTGLRLMTTMLEQA